ncbi:MAG: hypothetical protein WB778_01775 [Thermoplasmata archaeon]
MPLPLVGIFLALLFLYMVYSEWRRLDSRYPIVAALVLLVVTAVVDAGGNLNAANTLAEFVFFLLAAGVILLLVDHAREARRRPEPLGRRGRSVRSDTPASDPTEQTERATDHTLDRFEQ